MLAGRFPRILLIIAPLRPVAPHDQRPRPGRGSASAAGSTLELCAETHEPSGSWTRCVIADAALNKIIDWLNTQLTTGMRVGVRVNVRSHVRSNVHSIWYLDNELPEASTPPGPLG